MTEIQIDSFLAPVMNALSVFRIVAKLGSVSAASKQLGVSQSSLSRQVQKLESYLGCRLFLRQNRRMELTMAGQKLFEEVDRGLGNISSRAQSLQQTDGTTEINLVCGHGFANFWLLEHFPRLQRSFPEMQINLSVGPLGMPDLKSAPDLDVRLGAHPDPEWYSDMLIPEEICLAASAEFIKSRAVERRTLSNLRELPLLHMDQGEYGIHWFGSFFAEFGIDYKPPQDTLFYNSYPHIVQAAIESKGICILWRGLNGDLLESGTLLKIPRTAIIGNSGYYLTCRRAVKDEVPIAKIRRWIVNGCTMAARTR